MSVVSIKRVPGIVFMCELAVTLELYRETNSLSDADAHYFQIKEFVFALSA
jgi:hypothetical protein